MIVLTIESVKRLNLMLLGGKGFMAYREQLKVAILIADTYASPFSEIKAAIHPQIWTELGFNKVDVFYSSGFQNGSLMRRFNLKMEDLRYSKYSFFQRILNLLMLTPVGLLLPEARLISKHEIRVPIPEGLQFLGIKILSSLELLEKLGYGVVIRTTLSSVLNRTHIDEILAKTNPEAELYCGPTVNHGKEEFISGSGLILSAKTIRVLIAKRIWWNHWVLDDVAIGRILKGRAKLEKITSLNLGNLREIQDLSDETISSTAHFRCRSTESPRNDVELIRYLSIRIMASQKSKKGLI